MSRQITRLEEHINEREITIQTMITRIGNFYSMYSDTEKKVKSLLKKEEAFDVVVGDVETIRNQQQKFKVSCMFHFRITLQYFTIHI